MPVHLRLPIARRSHCGFTLIEALVALGLLMIGIFAVIQIFPIGFSTIGYTRNLQIAARLAEGEIERVLASPANVPGRIVATDAAGNVLNYDPDDLLYNAAPYAAGTVSVTSGSPDVTGSGTAWLDPDNAVLPGCLFQVNGDSAWYIILSISAGDALTLDRDYAGASGSRGYTIERLSWEPDAVFLPRTIIGETVEIPRKSPAAGERDVPKYVLTFGPILPWSADDPANDYDGPVIVYSTRYYPVDDPALLGSDEERFQYVIDNTTGVLTFDTVAYDRSFKVDYSWMDIGAGGPTTQSKVGETFTVAGGTNTYTLTPDGTNPMSADQQVVPGSERVHRTFGYVEYDPSDPTKPPNVPLERGQFTMTDVDRILGVVRFSPDDALTTVLIDYRTADWQIMRQNKQVGDDADGLVRLAAFPVRKAEFRNEPRQRQALYVDWSNQHDIVAIDVDTGEALYGADTAQAFGTPDAAGYAGTFALRVDRGANLDDYRDGAVRFSGPGVDRSGETYRIYYRAEEDWGVRVSKAADRYYADATTGAQQDQQYTLTKDSGDKQAQLSFRLSERGKSVMVDYTVYPDPASQQPGKRYSGELHTIVPHPDEEARGLVVLDQAIDFAANEDVAIHRVEGASLGAAAVWVNAKRRSVAKHRDPVSGKQIGLQERVMSRSTETFAAAGR